MSTAAACVVFASIWAAGCSDNGNSHNDSLPKSSTSSAAACFPAGSIADRDLAAFSASLKLPPGVQVITGAVNTYNKRPDQVVVSLDLCIPDSSDSEGLRPVATDIAHALKKSNLGARTAVLYIADRDSGYTKDEAKLRDGDFQEHAWNGKPSRDSELRIWEIVGS